MAIVREEEAKESWCPFVRFTFADGYLLTSRGETLHRATSADYASATSCLGKACMAWIVSSEKSGSCGLVR